MIHQSNTLEDLGIFLLGLQRLDEIQLQRKLEACDTLLRLYSAHAVAPALTELLIHSPML